VAAIAHPDRYLLRAKDLIDARYADPLDTAALAAQACCSEAHFIRSFKRAFGETPHQYLLTRRLERAAALLRATDYSVAEVCLNVGLASVGSFTTSFRRVYGMTPTAYRAAYPPAARLVPIPTCVVMAHARPSRNGEDRRAGRQ
jgi:AraC-like DNA-binding protein